MKNFKQRALAWAKANPEHIVSTYTNSPSGDRSLRYNYQGQCSYWSVTHKKPLTEVILEWENEMSNEMPKLEAGMVVYHDKLNYYYLLVSDKHGIRAGGHQSISPRDISKVFKYDWYGDLSSIINKAENLNPIWQRESKEESELKSVIADLEKNLADAKERLKAIK